MLVKILRKNYIVLKWTISLLIPVRNAFYTCSNQGLTKRKLNTSFVYIWILPLMLILHKISRHEKGLNLFDWNLKAQAVH